MAKGTPLASRVHRANRNRHVRTVVGVKLRNGSIQNQVKTLTPKQCQELHYATNLQVLDRINDLSEEKCRQFFLLREAQGFDDMDEGNSHEMTIDEALTGNIEFDISHAGGEFQDQLKHEMDKARAKDTRPRTDATLRRVLGFRGQMKAITDAYIKWGATQGEYGADSPAVPPSPTSTTAGSDGIFLSLCRHGFVLLVADMVRSGEQAKYPLAIVDALLDAFDPDVGSGYDIGCGFGTTVCNSPMAEKAADLNFKSLVGAFHGHAHNRRCQLAFLATYVPGMGLEDLEGCERFFSKSNALAWSTRYASIFHRRQTISTYLAHTDTFDTYANLSEPGSVSLPTTQLIVRPLALHVAMAQLGVQDVSEFPERLEQEKEYLNGLGKEPEEETDQEIFDTRCAESSKSTKTTCRHAQESYDRVLADVQESEAKMGIDPRWTLESKEWEDVALLVSRRRYRLSINQLEALVLKRMFELTKMNMSGTGRNDIAPALSLESNKSPGYKMRKHIAKALQSRSQAIRNGLARYNAAAAALVPPARSLTWTEVIDYTFLSEWDLLQDPEGNAQLLPWATPAARLVLDIYFKIERAREEIEHRNVEIRRLYQWKCGHFNAGYIQRLVAMQKKLGRRFTGTLQPGERIRGPIQTSRGMEGMDDDDDEAEAEELRELVERLGKEEEEDTWEDYIGEEAEDEELSEMLETVLGVASDSGVVE
ncbi:hypothetical protein DFH09DRAFT_1086373 [Mycena vulgaris]|nr:hypothetical protein DFH09DRAFT_1086373 [Mycena vulgaris]